MNTVKGSFFISSFKWLCALFMPFVLGSLNSLFVPTCLHFAGFSPISPLSTALQFFIPGLTCSPCAAHFAPSHKCAASIFVPLLYLLFFLSFLIFAFFMYGFKLGPLVNFLIFAVGLISGIFCCFYFSRENDDFEE